MWKHLSTVVAFLLFLTGGQLTLAQAQPNRVHLWLTLLHNSNGESNLVDLGSGLEDFGGAARFKTLVDDLVSQAVLGAPAANQRGAIRGALVVSSGDSFLAGPEFSAGLQMGVPFYDTIAMDLIGYDAVALGNREFDFGPDVLADFIEGFEDPPTFVSANLDVSLEARLHTLVDAGVIARSTVVRERGEPIGIVGATTPSLPLVSSPRDVVVDEDVAAAVQAEVDMLTAQGINKIILISHLQDIDADIALAAQLDGIDIIVSGGGDELLANPGNLLVPGDEGFVFGPYPITAFDFDGTAVPVVTTFGSYAYVGRLTIGFDRDGNILEIDDQSGPVRVAGGANPDAVLPDPEVQARVVEPVKAALAALETNVIADSEVDLDGLRSSVRSRETNEGNLVADSLLWQAMLLAFSYGVAEPDVALQNSGGIRNNDIVPAGDFTELDTFVMLPFPNFVTILENIPRAQFKEILENAVSRTQPGDEPGGTGRFAQIAGFSFVWSGSGTAQVLDADGIVVVPGTRIQDVTLDDATAIVTNGSVVAGPDLTVATLDFLARGGEQYPFRAAPFTILGASYQQALSNYVVDALDGLITAADYPENGEGRITEIP